jgi:membrane-bound lytic murein transglycosylase D
MLTRFSRFAGTVFAALLLAGCAALSESTLPLPAPRPVLSPAKPAPPAPAARAERRPPAGTANSTNPAPSTLIRLPESTVPAEQLRVPSAGNAYGDLMDRIRGGFKLPENDATRSAVDVQLAWYERNPAYLDRVFGRAALYMHYIVEEIERRGMPMELALLPVVESAFEPFAYSKARASGLWQFIPDTGNRFGLPQNWWYDGRRDVVESTRAALDYLQFLHDEFEGDWLLAVAGYNCGENCVAQQGRGITDELLGSAPARRDARLCAEAAGHEASRLGPGGARHRVQPDPERTVFHQGDRRFADRPQARRGSRGTDAR